nr:hypothetical protein [Tanacetum cinerariifolium]
RAWRRLLLGLSYFGMIPTAISTSVPIVDPPVFHDDTALILTETPTISLVVSTLPHTSLFMSKVAARSSPPSPPTSQILLAPPGLPRRPMIPVLPGQPILVGRPYRTLPNEVHHFSLDDSSSDSSSNSSSGYSSDTLVGRYILDSSFDTPVRFVGPSRKRCRSHAVSVPLATPVPGALSLIRADLLPPRKRIIGVVIASDYDDSAKESREVDVGVEASIRSVGDDEVEEKAESEDRGTIEIGVDRVIKSVQRHQGHMMNGYGDRGGTDNRKGLGGGNGDRNANIDFGGIVPVARECTYQDFVKSQPLNFKGTEGFDAVVIGLIHEVLHLLMQST